jgi:hypothetical protein
MDMPVGDAPVPVDHDESGIIPRGFRRDLSAKIGSRTFVPASVTDDFIGGQLEVRHWAQAAVDAERVEPGQADREA